MRAPPYIRTRNKGATVEILLWHPTFWVEVWRALEVQPRWMKPAAFVYCLYRFWREAIS